MFSFSTTYNGAAKRAGNAVRVSVKLFAHSMFCALNLFMAFFILEMPAAHGQTPPRGQNDLEVVTLSKCQNLLENPDAKCGVYEVFENRESRKGRKIALKIILLPAISASHKPDPLVILAGGPGQAATENLEFWARIFADVRRERDLLLVDQRGTGHSNGLKCDLYQGDLQNYFGDRFPVEGAQACRRSLESKADLRFYTTQIAMQDLDEIRQALGYEKLNLFGTSYGTRAAQVYLRNFPTRVRTMILKGVMGFELTDAGDTERALDLLFQDCLADSTCKSLIPDIKQDYETLMARLQKEKVRVTIKHPDTGAPVVVEFPPIVLRSTMRSLLQNVGAGNQTLALIHSAAAGDLAPLAQTVINLRRGLVKELSVGMMLSVFCSEDAALGKAEAAVGPDKLSAVCRDWPKGVLPAGYMMPVKSDIPVLLISGHLDSATPPRWGEEVAKGFPHSLSLMIRNASHSYTGLSPCVDRIMSQFISTATTDKLDVSCINTIKRPAFK